jgi:hypothetical protein
LMDHSFEAGVEVTGVMNGGTAGKSERNGRVDGSALFFCNYLHTRGLAENSNARFA